MADYGYDKGPCDQDIQEPEEPEDVPTWVMYVLYGLVFFGIIVPIGLALLFGLPECGCGK